MHAKRPESKTSKQGATATNTLLLPINKTKDISSNRLTTPNINMA